MNAYERLEHEACRDGIDVIEYTFENKTIKGLYCDGTAAIRKDLETSAEKTCVLAEELGHHYTSVGNILDQSDPDNRKQEILARTWAYDGLIGLSRIIDAYKYGCQNRYEIAEYLEVTEEFLQDCIDRYRSKYGICKQFEDYIIYFEPTLAVGKITD